MQCWTCPQNEEIDEAVKEDLNNILLLFIKNKQMAFDHFKSAWKSLGLSRIHGACPKRVKPVHFTHILYSNGNNDILLLVILNQPRDLYFPLCLALYLLNSYPPGTFEDHIHHSCAEVVWNIGVFYLLYVLFKTAPPIPDGGRIRVGPEEWTLLLLIHERMQFLIGTFCHQAVKAFHKLLAVDAFQFSLYSGIPSLHQLTRLTQRLSSAPTVAVEAVPLTHTNIHHQSDSTVGGSAMSSSDTQDTPARIVSGRSPATGACLSRTLQGNKYIAQHAQEVVQNLLSAGFTYAEVAGAPDSGTAEGEEGESEGVNGQAWHDAFGDFFGSVMPTHVGGGTNVSERSISGVSGTPTVSDHGLHEMTRQQQEDEVSDDEGGGERSLLDILQQLERETQEVLGDPGSVQGTGTGKRKRKRMTATRRSERQENSSTLRGTHNAKGPQTTGGVTMGTGVGVVSSAAAGYGISDVDVTEASGEGAHVRSAMDILALLERETMEVLEGEEQERLHGHEELPVGRKVRRKQVKQSARTQLAGKKGGGHGGGVGTKSRKPKHQVPVSCGSFNDVEGNSNGTDPEGASVVIDDVLRALELATNEVMNDSAEI